MKTRTHFTFRVDAALLAARVDLELVIGRGVVAAIAGIGDAAIEDVADERLHLWNDRAQRVPVIYCRAVLRHG